MKNFKQNKDKQHFLKESKANISKLHKEYLGNEIPEGYFEKSKISILEKIKAETTIEATERPKKKLIFYLRPQFKYAVAASLLLLVSVTIWLQNSTSTVDFNTTSIESLALEDDILLESLLVDDAAVDEFADATLFNEIVVKAEATEQKLDNLILNSLIVEDSLLDDYIKKELIETIIL